MKQIERSGRRMIEFIIMLIPMSVIFFTMFDLDGSKLFYLVVLLSAVYTLAVFATSPVYFIKEYKEELLFFAIALAGILVNHDYSSVYSYVRLMEVGVFLIALQAYSKNTSVADENKNQELIFWTICIVTFGILLVSLILQGLYFCGISISSMLYYKDGIFGGLYGNGNQLGIYAYISLMLSLHLYHDHKNRFLLANILFEALAISISGCRSIMIILAITILWFAASKIRTMEDRHKARQYTVYAACFVIIAVIALVFVSYEKAGMYYWAYSFELLLDRITGNRYSIWKEALTIFCQHPIFGVGLGNLHSYAISELPSSAVYVYRGYENAHNMIINILAYTGIVGFASAILLARKYIANALVFAKQFQCKWLIALCIGLVVADQLDILIVFNDRLPIYVFFLIVGYFCLNARKAKRVE